MRSVSQPAEQNLTAGRHLQKHVQVRVYVLSDIFNDLRLGALLASGILRLVLVADLVHQ